jgi:hypothetical protein
MKETAGGTSASQMIEAAIKILQAMTLNKIFPLAGLGIFIPNSFAFGQVQYVEKVGLPGSFPIVQQSVEDNARHGRTTHMLAKSGYGHYHAGRRW